MTNKKQNKDKEIPMGVSQWREHGKNYGYWDYFIKQERERIIQIIESKGHQQEDDTIWCNMDDLIKTLKEKINTK